MTRLVIESPDLQTPAQRLSALIIGIAGWILWLYVTFPVLTVCGWLLDISICSVWMNWSGGYMSLQELMQFYAGIAVGLFFFWFFWMKIRLSRRYDASKRPVARKLETVAVAKAYHVDHSLLQQCRRSRMVTVHFDAQGRIIQLQG